jgi:hypothetical protein
MFCNVILLTDLEEKLKHIQNHLDQAVLTIPILAQYAKLGLSSQHSKTQKQFAMSFLAQ